MKKRLLLLLPLFILLFTFAACNRAVDSPGGGAPQEKTSVHYKSSMKPYDELVPAERIVILQNVFNPDARDGFYTRAARPAAVEIEYNNDKTAAYPISYAIDLLHNGNEGPVTVTKTDGGKAEFPAADFRGMYVILDLRSDTPPVLYNPATKSTATNFAYAVTSEGEAIYSVVSNSDHNVNELLVKAGWAIDATYRVVATDKFHLPLEPEEAITGDLRGALSGAVNGAFPDMSLAGGRINDVLFIERVVD